MTLIRRVTVCTGVTAVFFALLTAPAHAQASRTWVSGVGDDANPCSRTAPCKTWAGAISKTAVGGTINAIDSGGFGAVTITKSITIDGGGVEASALASGTNGIIINAGAGDVVLRDIDITGVDTNPDACTSPNGVQIVSAGSVRLERLSISGFNRGVNAPLTSSPGGGSAALAFDDIDVVNNCEYGLRIAPEGGGTARATLDGVAISGSNVALSIGAAAEAWVSRSKFHLNDLGLQSEGGPIHSVCNNSVAGNTSPGAFTDDWRCGVATAPPVPSPLPGTVSYCSVPKLKGSTVNQARSKLQKAGCRLGKVGKQKVSRSKQRKKVQTQSIPARVQVRQGTAVAIRIGK